jgi:hypothetical protein
MLCAIARATCKAATKPGAKSRISNTSSTASKMTDQFIKTPPTMINKMEGKYDGKELLPYACRPGAMDAFKLPSLMHFGHVYRKDVETLK